MKLEVAEKNREFYWVEVSILRFNKGYNTFDIYT